MYNFIDIIKLNRVIVFLSYKNNQAENGFSGNFISASSSMNIFVINVKKILMIYYVRKKEKIMHHAWV